MQLFCFHRHVVRHAIALACGLVFAACGGSGSRDITIVYPSASGLEVGDELRLSGYAIGVVEELALLKDGQIGVRVQIQPEYTQHITVGIIFSIKREGLFSPDRFIELTPGEAKVVSKETRFVGEPSWEDRLKSMTDQLLDSTGDVEFRQHLDALAEAAERAAEAGQREWEARRPELESEAKRLLEQFEQEGNEAAEQLRLEIEKYLEELLREEPEASPEPETIGI